MPDVKKIVMIDDEEDLCAMVKEKLEDTGKFDVQTLSDSTQAVDLIRAQSPDIVLLDVVMPQMNGPAVVAALKEEEDLKKTPIIIVSGKGEMVYNRRKDDFHWEPNSDLVRNRGELPDSKSAEALAEAYGVADYVSKPFTIELLIQVIEEVIKKHKPAESDEDGIIS